MKADVAIGMFFSQLIMWAIMVTAASLYLHVFAYRFLLLAFYIVFEVVSSSSCYHVTRTSNVFTLIKWISTNFSSISKFILSL
jgi:hypothetical protein